MTDAIEVRGLEKRYGGFTLGPLDFALPGGCVLGLLGENGAGDLRGTPELIRAEND